MRGCLGAAFVTRSRPNRAVNIAGQTTGNLRPKRLSRPPPLCFCSRSAFTAPLPCFTDSIRFAHAIVAVPSAYPERESQGGRDRIASPDAARGHDPAGSGRYLCLAAAGLAGAEKDRADRARRAKPRRRPRTVDADTAIGGP